MKSFKSLYKGLVLGLSLSILGLGSTFCGGSSGGGSSGGGLKVWLQNPPANNAYYRTNQVCVDGAVSGTKDFGWEPNSSVGFNGLVGKLNGCFPLAKGSPLTEQYLDAYAGSLEKSVSFTPLNNPPVANAGEDQFSSAGAELIFNGFGEDVDGTINKCYWNFGDGETYTDNSPIKAPDGKFYCTANHIYNFSINPGDFTPDFKPTLTVTDNDGSLDVDVTDVYL